MRRAVVMGMGVTGRAVAEALGRRGIEVAAFDDRVGDTLSAWSAEHGIEVQQADPEGVAKALVGADAALPTPGLPASHGFFRAAEAAGVPIRSELDLAQEWDDRPVAAITGTDGKTTVVTMVEQMLNHAGITALAVGNTDVPAVTAIDDPELEVLVVEASSFRLAHSSTFAPDVGTWINFGPDHLDAHGSLAAYESAKASIWARSAGGHVAVANRQDPVVARHLHRLGPEVTCETFGLDDVDKPTGHGLSGTTLVLEGEPLIDRSELFDQRPHDVANVLAAAVTASKLGASRSSIAAVAASFAGLPHRTQVLGQRAGVRWVNDSKATTPHATEAAVRAYPSVVLIAGGRNKGLSFAGLTALSPHIRHVVALGEAAADIVAAFDGRPTTQVDDMAEAVAVAASVAQAGDTVLLSPACASFDQYTSYRARGDHFAELAERLLHGAPTQ